MDYRSTRFWHKARVLFDPARYWFKGEIKKGNIHNLCGFVDNVSESAGFH